MTLNRDFVDELSSGEFFLQQTASELKISLDKIENTQSMMEGIINYYAKAEDLLKIELTQ